VSKATRQDGRDPASQTEYGRAVLGALSRPDRWLSVYGGTVALAVVAQRRRRAKAARRADRARRQRG
jgi:hypothetical protein